MSALTQEMVDSKFQTIDPRTKAFIDGSFVSSKSGETFDSVSPRDGSIIAKVARCRGEDVDAAIRSARAAFEDGRWSRLKPAQRKATLLRFAALLREHRLELAMLESIDMGKPIADAYNVDLQSSATVLQYYAEAADKVYDQLAPTSPDIIGMINREPLGVVGAVVPWNFPLMMAAWKLGPALVTGNSVVLKPAEQSPLSALLAAELAAEAGVPPGVFNVVPGFGDEAGAALGLHHDVDAVGFTGSIEVGKKFLEYSAQSNMKHISLECGGKSPQIVMADAVDIDTIGKNVAAGIFFNQGEVCNAGSRLLVDERIKDKLLDRVIHHSQALQPGDPLDISSGAGAIVDKTQMDRVLTYIDSGNSGGATLRSGGAQVRAESGGYYVEPTIFEDVGRDMAIAKEEIFGPVLSTFTFDDEDDAIRLSNDTVYGLAAAVWTENINTAHRVASRLRAGTVWVNCFDSSDVTVPFGGYKQSGQGRDKSLHALEKYTQLKTTWIEVH